MIEITLRGVSKALVAQRMHAEAASDCVITAVGDDCTDDELCRALPLSCATVVVGHRPSCARCRVADHREVRRILRWLVNAGQTLSVAAAKSVC